MDRVFLEIVLPTLVMVGLGFVIHRLRGTEVQPLSQVTLYVLNPALIFSSLTRTTLSPQDALQIVTFVLALAGAMYVLTWGITRAARMDRALESAFLLTTVFMNAGNYGLSITFLAFQAVGLERAIIFFVCQAILSGTLGVYLASRSRATGWAPLAEIFRMPQVYAAVLALFVNVMQLQLPIFVAKPAELAGGAAIPSMLLVLGMQLSTHPGLEELFALFTATFVKLIGSAGVALLLTSLFGIRGLTQQVLILQASMPTAVFPIILATEFDARPQFVTGVVLVSTLASTLTLTILLSLMLGARALP